MWTQNVACIFMDHVFTFMNEAPPSTMRDDLVDYWFVQSMVCPNGDTSNLVAVNAYFCIKFWPFWVKSNDIKYLAVFVQLISWNFIVLFYIKKKQNYILKLLTYNTDKLSYYLVLPTLSSICFSHAKTQMVEVLSIKVCISTWK